jgi:hypothetical protein
MVRVTAISFTNLLTRLAGLALLVAAFVTDVTGGVVLLHGWRN